MAKSSNLLGNGTVSLCIDSCQAWVGRRRISLTATEFNLLACLLRHQGTVLTRDQLLDQVWGLSYKGTSRTVDTHIQRLRSKLSGAGTRLRTVRGVGYCLD